MTTTSVLERAERTAVESGAVGLNVLKAAALHAAVSDALHFAAPASAKAPALEAVRLEAVDGQFVAVATDRFTLGASRVEYSGAAFTVLIAASDAKVLAAMAKTGKRDENWREAAIDVASDGVQLTFRFNSGEALTVRSLDVEFPKWRHLLPVDAERMSSTVGMGYEPSRLAKFTKVRPGERGAALVAFPSVASGGQPGVTVIQVGPDFIGVLLPMRPAGNVWGYQRPDWLHQPDIGATSGTNGGS